MSNGTLTRRAGGTPPVVADPEAFGPWDLTDDGLARVEADVVHLIESGHADAERLEADLALNREERGRRRALARQWGAISGGTDSYDLYERCGFAPSYWLALQLDSAAREAGEPHALVRREDQGTVECAAAQCTARFFLIPERRYPFLCLDHAEDTARRAAGARFMPDRVKPTTRLRVAKGSYRGVDGWRITGTDARGRHVRVFFEHESAARRTIDRLRDDSTYEVELEDFEP